MIVVIAEKTDIAKAVSKVLPEKALWKNGYIEQGEYYITWCYGHLLTLKDPEDYGEQYSRANTPNEKLPIFFENWGLKVGSAGPSLLKNGKQAPDKEEQLKIIGSLLKNASSVIIAGDIDDEGQLLVEEVLEWHKYTGPIKRLDTGALNEASMRKAMSNLMDNNAWHLRALSARARSVADFALGINGSRFFSNTYKANLSIGRVQTATLGLVTARDALIEGHTSMSYYLLDADAKLKNSISHSVRFNPNEDCPALIDGKITKKEYLEKLSKSLNGKSFTGIVTKETVQDTPPLPLSISALKTYCSTKFNITPEETLQITQSLRMNYGGLITYNRSECRYLPENMHSEAGNIIAAVQSNFGAEWNYQNIDTNIKSKAFNDKNVSVHHAIIPTSERADLSKLTEKELKVYKTIVLFYVIQFMSPARKERTKLAIKCTEGCFAATSTKTLYDGFKSVLEAERETETPLSDIPAGNYVVESLTGFSISEKQTKPPQRYTDASLEEEMKSVAKYVTDPEAKRLLLLKDKDNKEEHGSIGTAATRSAIIQTLKKRGFIENKGKYIVSTQVGRDFYEVLPDEIRKPDLTAKWWAIQQDIQEGKAVPEDLYREVLASYDRFAKEKYPSKNLQTFKKEKEDSKKSVGVCPRCGHPIVETEKAFSCSGYKNGCKFAIWKDGDYGIYKVLHTSKKKMTATMVKSLLKNNKVLVKGLYSERTGKKYDAYFVMQDKGNAVFLTLSFDEIKK